MEEVKVTELRQNLPEYLAKVKRGERVRVTSRGKVIAEIVPPPTQNDSEEVARARELLKRSVVRCDDPLEPAFESQEWDVDK
jgi:prevent-host-death family protein